MEFKFLVELPEHSSAARVLVLKNKVVLITGATSGIGKATAIAFGKAGAKVVLSGRHQARRRRPHQNRRAGACRFWHPRGRRIACRD